MLMWVSVAKIWLVLTVVQSFWYNKRVDLKQSNMPLGWEWEFLKTEQYIGSRNRD
jgi:hypothetical protein